MTAIQCLGALLLLALVEAFVYFWNRNRQTKLQKIARELGLIYYRNDIDILGSALGKLEMFNGDVTFSFSHLISTSKEGVDIKMFDTMPMTNNKALGPSAKPPLPVTKTIGWGNAPDLNLPKFEGIYEDTSGNHFVEAMNDDFIYYKQGIRKTIPPTKTDVVHFLELGVLIYHWLKTQK